MPRQLGLVVERNVVIPMRDGARLYADLYRPAEGGPFPTILTRTPYNKGAIDLPPPYEPRRSSPLDAVQAASSGFAVVVQDVRGRYASEGTFNPFHQEVRDGYDTVEWCAAQPWCNGRVGMQGISYTGATQWLAALAGAPHLVAIIPGLTSSEYYDGWTYSGGAFQLGFTLSWSLGALMADSRQKRLGVEPARAAQEADLDGLPDRWWLPLETLGDQLASDAPYFREWARRTSRADEFWRSICLADHYDRLAVAALNIGGWWDIFLVGTLRNYVGMRQRGPAHLRAAQRLLVGPWAHLNPGWNQGAGEYTAGFNANVDYDRLALRWFGHWLRGDPNGVDREPPVRLYVLGANRWRDASDWPVPGTEFVRFYLHSTGRAATDLADGLLSTEPPGDEPADLWLSDPSRPVPTVGGPLCCWKPALPPGPFDQRPIEARPDVLVYSTPPLERPLEVTGPVIVELWATSSALDADFTAKLVDVLPNGYARNLTDGIVRASRPNGEAEPQWLRPGEPRRFTIDLAGTSNRFGVGHRIRLEIASSSFPRFDRNPQPGSPEEVGDGQLHPATQTVFHDRARPSCIVLPLLPAD